VAIIISEANFVFGFSMLGSAKINPQFDDNDLHTISRTLGRPKERISRSLTDAGGSISYFLSISESGT
jgi:hypothetical protein